MRVFGICVVRNEVDIIRLTVLHHLSLGLDKVLVLDNGSTDGTDEVLRELSGDRRVDWVRDGSGFDQVALTTKLAREAHRRGADWILPFDADEFWWAKDADLTGTLANSEVGALKVPVVNFVQSRDRRDLSPDALLTMTRRVARPAGSSIACRELIEAGKIGFVEMRYPPKWISRSSETLEILRGNHEVAGVDGPRELGRGIFCLHAPLRSRAILESKAEQGRRLDEAGVPATSAWHMRRWNRLEEEGLLDQEWAANSYHNGYLDVYGERREVVFDPRLRNVVEPILARLRNPDAVGRLP